MYVNAFFFLQFKMNYVILEKLEEKMNEQIWKIRIKWRIIKINQWIRFWKTNTYSRKYYPCYFGRLWCHWTSTNRNRKNFGVFKYFTYKFKRKKKETTSVYFITNKRTYHANSWRIKKTWKIQFFTFCLCLWW